MMKSQAQQIHIKLVRDRFHYLNLNDEQAEKIHNQEQSNDTIREKHHLSVWEEAEYESRFFGEILNPVQLKDYETFLREKIQHAEQLMIDEDLEKLNEIQYYRELINIYENEFSTDFHETISGCFDLPSNDQLKVTHLKAKYRQFLCDTENRILAGHFRYFKTFKPNGLKVSLLRHQFAHILPDYTSFRNQVDKSTQAVIDQLYKELNYSSEETEQKVTTTFNELKELSDLSFKRHYEVIGSLNDLTVQLTYKEERELQIMTLLLLDKERYDRLKLEAS